MFKWVSEHFLQTHNLDRSDTPHQLLQQSGVTVRKLADALSDKLLLKHGEAIAVSTLQQTAGHRSGRFNILGNLSQSDSQHATCPQLKSQMNSPLDEAVQFVLSVFEEGGTFSQHTAYVMHLHGEHFVHVLLLNALLTDELHHPPALLQSLGLRQQGVFLHQHHHL